MSDDPAEPIDRLRAIEIDLQRAGSSQAAWFSTCLARYTNKKARDLDEAFETAAPKSGGRTALYAFLVRERDEALRSAFNQIEGASPASRLDELYQRAAGLAASWEELGRLDEPDPSWSDLKTTIWAALKYAELSHHSIPGKKRLATIVVEPQSHDLDEVVG